MPLALLDLVCAAATALSVMLALLWLRRRILRVPAEDRSFMDPPPGMLRWIWQPIHWLSTAVDRVQPTQLQGVLRLRLRRAGLAHRMTPAQFLALCLLGAATSGGVLGAGAWMLLDALSRIALLTLAGMLGGAGLPLLWLQRRIDATRRDVARTLPFLMDLLTLCVEAGLNLQGAFQQAILRGPKGVLRDELHELMRDLRAGKSRAAALADVATRIGDPAVSRLVSALTHAEASGMNLGPVLRRQADDSRAERFQRAELAAFRAPVKMLLPLITLIFPCTFIVIFFPIAMELLGGGR